MKRPSTLFAGLTISAALVLGGCSTGIGAATVAADAAAAAVTTSSLTGAVAELDYADLGINEANLSIDTADAVAVTLADGTSEGGSGVNVDGDSVTITEGGTYRVSGSLSSGSLVVDAPDEVVNLVLDGVDITAASVAAINVVDADQVVIWLAAGSDNVLADAVGSAVEETVEDSPNATLYSTSDLWIAGDGALSVTAHAADAITSKDSLVLAGGDVTVDAADDGVRGKDHLVITGGTLEADVSGDALRSDNESVTDEPDAAVGVIWIDGGTLDLTAGADAVDAARQVTVRSGDLTIAAGDDGLHSDGVLRIAGGTVNITESVEGIEGAYMYLSGGDVSVVAADDGINVAGGAEEVTETVGQPITGTEPGMAGDPGTAVEPGAAADEGMAAAGPPAGGPAGGPPMGGPPMGGPPTDDMAAGGQAMPGGAGPGSQFTTTEAVEDLSSLSVSTMEGSGFGGPAEADNGTRFLEFSGGTYVLDTMSDGVDVNGAMTMTGGTLVVSSTDDARNGAIDVDDAFTISGGTLAANGTSAMAVAPGDGSTQATLALTFSGTVPGATVITITDADGQQIASFTTQRDSQSFIYSSDALVAGSEYTISVGGEVSGTEIGGLVLDGVATGGDTVGTVQPA